MSVVYWIPAFAGMTSGTLLGGAERLGLRQGRWRRRVLLRRASDELLIIFAHGLAALRSRRVHRVALELRDEGADVLHALRVEPAPLDAAPDGEQIGLRLVGANELVS